MTRRGTQGKRGGSKPAAKQDKVARSKASSGPKQLLADPVELARQGQFKRALYVLQTRLAVQPNDQDRRLMIYCLLKLEQHSELIQAIESLEVKDADDYGLLGWVHIQLEEWDNAVQCLDEGLAHQETAEDYYWLATAIARGNRYSVRDEEAKRRISECLTKAVHLPGCREDAYLWLARMAGWQDEDIPVRLSILEEALEKYPEYELVRYEIASLLLYRAHDPKKVLEVLEPITAGGNTHTQALWYEFIARTQLEDYALALTAIDAIAPNEIRPEDRALFRGDTLLQLGKPSDALSEYATLVNSDDRAQHILGLMCSARALLEAGNREEAMTSASMGIEIWLRQGLDFDDWFSAGPVLHRRRATFL